MASAKADRVRKAVFHAIRSFRPMSVLSSRHPASARRPSRSRSRRCSWVALSQMRLDIRLSKES